MNAWISLLRTKSRVEIRNDFIVFSLEYYNMSIDDDDDDVWGEYYWFVTKQFTQQFQLNFVLSFTSSL